MPVGSRVLAIRGLPRRSPDRLQETPQNWKPAQPADQTLRGKWWEIYQDPQLNTLEEKINISNQSLKAAQAQFEQARQLFATTARITIQRSRQE